MNYIVFDLEWNQGERRDKAVPLPFEIIEIGAIKLDEHFKRVDSFHRIIRPVVHPKLFSHTKTLIALTEESLCQGTTFKRACKEFLSWCGKGGEEYMFATWGDHDVFELQKNMNFYKIPNPFPRPVYFFDVQLLFNLHTTGNTTSPISLEKAAKQLQIPEKEAFHSAINDAEYTAALFLLLPPDIIKRYPSVDTFRFPIHEDEEADIRYPDRSMYVSRAYKTKEALKIASSLRPLYCHICNQKARRLTPWINSNSKSCLSLGKCRHHGFLRSKRTVKHPDEHHFFELTTVRTVSELEANSFLTAYRNKSKKTGETS